VTTTTTTIPIVGTSTTTTTLAIGPIDSSRPPPPLVRTGSNAATEAGVALLFVMFGAHLVVGTRRRRQAYVTDWS